MDKIKKIFCDLISAVYPNKCICCSDIIDEGKQLCENCAAVIERNNLFDMCTNCGFEKSECVCKYNVYRFSGLVCALKNVGHAKDIYYAYKFGKRQHYSNFFAKEMCKAVDICYSDIKFDLICAVPSNKRYGYNHSTYLAQIISKKFNIPYNDNLICCVKKTKKQHKSTIQERLNNPNGKYACDFKIDGSTVLLVDDIKTTGSTLDECAKMLLFAGAQNVYCVTALGSSLKK